MSKKLPEQKPSEQPKITKPTAAQVEARVAEVVDLLLSGLTRTEVVRFTAKTWNINSRQTDEYLARAKKEIMEVNKATYEENLATMAKTLWREFRRSHEPKDRVAVLKLLSHIHGLGSTKLIIEEKRELESLTDDELDELFESQMKENDNDS